MKKILFEQLGSVFEKLPLNPRVVVSGNQAVPWALLHALDKIIPEYKLHILNAPKGIPEREGVIHESVFVGEGMRKSPRLEYIPCRLSLVSKMLENYKPVDLVLVQVSKSYNNKVSLGIEVNILPSIMESVRKRGGLIFAQLNTQMPYTFGDGEYDQSFFDYIIEEESPLGCKNTVLLNDDARIIGERISNEVKDGATLQLGIGAVPNAFLMSLSEKRKNIKIWTEMFSDGVLHLEQKGRLDTDKPIVSSFAFGSQELYTWMDRNPRIQMLRTEYVNDPSNISKQNYMTSVNAALQVDLYDQANASRIGNKIYSGFGGSTDFIVGALHSHGGKAFVALPSWHPKANVSTIIPKLIEPTTHFQHSFIVTERGLSQMYGKDQSEQALGLIKNCAHPNFHEVLYKEGKELGLF